MIREGEVAVAFVTYLPGLHAGGGSVDRRIRRINMIIVLLVLFVMSNLQIIFMIH